MTSRVAIAAVLSLLAGSVAGLVVGRWQLVLAVAGATAAALVIGGLEAAAIGALAGAGFLAGLRLHHVVSEGYARN